MFGLPWAAGFLEAGRVDQLHTLHTPHLQLWGLWVLQELHEPGHDLGLDDLLDGRVALCRAVGREKEKEVSQREDWCWPSLLLLSLCLLFTAHTVVFPDAYNNVLVVSSVAAATSDLPMDNSFLNFWVASYCSRTSELNTPRTIMGTSSSCV